MKSNIRQLVNYPAKTDRPYAQWGINGRPIGYPGHIPNLSLALSLEYQFTAPPNLVRDFCIGIADRGPTPTELFIFKSEGHEPVLKLTLRDVVPNESDAGFVTVTKTFGDQSYNFVAYFNESEWIQLYWALEAEPYSSYRPE